MFTDTSSSCTHILDSSNKCRPFSVLDQILMMGFGKDLGHQHNEFAFPKRKPSRQSLLNQIHNIWRDDIPKKSKYLLGHFVLNKFQSVGRKNCLARWPFRAPYIIGFSSHKKGEMFTSTVAPQRSILRSTEVVVMYSFMLWSGAITEANIVNILIYKVYNVWCRYRCFCDSLITNSDLWMLWAMKVIE